MKDVRQLLDRVLSEAIAEVRGSGVRVFTFAFYHDHESRAVSVCVDTEESSKRFAVNTNAYNQKYFWRAIESGDLEDAALWNANTGRSLSLGDFAFVNLARCDLPKGKVTDDLYLEMIRAVKEREAEIVGLAESRASLLFCASARLARMMKLPSPGRLPRYQPDMKRRAHPSGADNSGRCRGRASALNL